MLRANFEALVIFNPQLNKKPPPEFLQSFARIGAICKALTADGNNQFVRVVVTVADWLSVQRVFPWLIHASHLHPN
jgi:hypothetical protein